jgi:hypothetical protein
MEIEGVFSTGQIAQGAMINIKSLSTNRVLFRKRLSKEGFVTVSIPNEPYFILFDAGPGHKIRREGVIIPKEGFDDVIHQKYSKIAFNTTLYLSVILILLSFIIHFFRVKKIIFDSFIK